VRRSAVEVFAGCGPSGSAKELSAGESWRALQQDGVPDKSSSLPFRIDESKPDAKLRYSSATGGKIGENTGTGSSCRHPVFGSLAAGSNN
jgi:hypothetical protein